MPQRMINLIDRMRRSAFAFPFAVLVAVLMVALSEVAYHGAAGELRTLITMGQVRLELSYLARRVTDAESGQRGYLLTGRAEYLTPYRNAAADARRSLQSLRHLYSQLNQTESERRRDDVERAVIGKLSELDEVLRLHDAGQPDAAHELLLTGIGRDQMDGIRDAVDELLAYQNQLVARGLQGIFDTLLLNRIGVAAMTVMSLLLLGMFLRQRHQLDRQRFERQVEMQAERDRLEAEVERRTAELTELARHLQTAREDERARLARDLHDELGALLTTAKLDVARIKPRLPGGNPELLERLTHLTQTLNSGIALKRRIIEDLRPSTLNNLGLGPALEILCNEFGERLGVPVIARIEPLRLAPSAELTVFRMVQEALNNVAKYAQASEVEVTLQAQGDQALVTLHDNGLGFDPHNVPAGHHGLMGMRFRVEAEGGMLEIASRPGGGTTLRARLPRQVEVEAGPTAEPTGALDEHVSPRT